MPKPMTQTGKGRRRQMTTGADGRLYPGEVYRGIITDHNYPHMTYTVCAVGQSVPGVIDVTGPVAALIGFKTTNRLTIGTSVLFVYGSQSFIIGTWAEDPPDPGSFQSRIMTGTAIKDAQGEMNPDGRLPHHSSPDDLYEGEFEITNLLGTCIRFLTFMASIGSGERAKVECHLLRDMVRIVSRNYEHFSSAGDFKILDDSRANIEFHGTTYEHERWGRLKENDQKFVPYRTTDMPEVDPQETGRWRYSMLLGFIGDLFNGWFSDPTAVVGRMAEEAVRGGKARVHVGQDGAVVVGSTSEIVLEKVVRVQVPIRIRHEEDPQGVLRKDIQELDSSFLKVWKIGDRSSEHHTLFQIREYVRYLNQYHSLARLHQQAKDWYVPSEAETPGPVVGAGEDDRQKANPDTTYWKDAYSTIRIFRDGSTLVYDAYGNATATGPFGIQHSSTRHIHLYAAGDIVLKAGGSLFASAKRHVEVIAHRGALLLKARTAWRALCEVGTLWIKSDMDPDAPYAPESGDPAAEAIGRQGVRIQAALAESRWISRLKARFVIERDSENFELDSKGGITVKAEKAVDMELRSTLNLTVRRMIGVVAKGWKNWLETGWLLDRVCQLKPGGSRINKLETAGLLSRGTIGGPENAGHPIPGPSKCCYRPHENHITVYTPTGDFSLSVSDDYQKVRLDQDPAGFNWKMLPPAEYVWNNPGMAVGKTDFDFEPLAQQTLRLAAPAAYGDWPRMSDRLRPAPQTAAEVPWPGEQFKWKMHHPSLPDLQTPTGQPATDFGPSIQTPLTSGQPLFKFLLK